VPLVDVAVTIDGVDIMLETDVATNLLRAMRDAGITVVPGACEQGECGSCSVLVDGRLVCACLVAAATCDGSDIRTAASLLTPDLAEEMAARGAVQCGFCTPGFVVAAEALLGARTEARLGRDDVREALAGNLCRCTGYETIIDSVVACHEARGR
jgi:carbon-monoxide dehydrogenase small subunit